MTVQTQPRRSPALTRPLLAGLARTPLPEVCTAPMLATPGIMPLRIADYGYEVKWDGYRALARCDGRRFMLCSRNGIDLSQRFPEIAFLGQSGGRQVLLDGEIVALEKDGRPSFSALQTRMPAPRGVSRGRTWDPRRYSIQYMVFDVLHCDGRSTCSLSYAERRGVLGSLSLHGPAWQVPPAHPDGPALLAVMRQARQEGIIAKRLTSRYLPGRRSPDWIKVKLDRSDEFLIIGSWSSGKHAVSSLLLGCYPTAADARAGRGLRYCGKVGTGFSEDDRRQLQHALAKLRVDEPPAEGDLPRAAGVTWCRPRLVAQIRYSEWTHDGALRHPAFLGLRSDKAPDEIVHRPGQE